MPYGMTSGSGFRISCQGELGHVGGTAKDNRRFVEAVLYRYRAGIPWRTSPCGLGISAWCILGICAGVRAGCGSRCSGTLRPTPQRIRHGYRCHDYPRPSTRRRGKRGDPEAECQAARGLEYQTPRDLDALGNPTSFCPGGTPGQASWPRWCGCAARPEGEAHLNTLLRIPRYDAPRAHPDVLEKHDALIPPKRIGGHAALL